MPQPRFRCLALYLSSTGNTGCPETKAPAATQAACEPGSAAEGIVQAGDGKHAAALTC